MVLTWGGIHIQLGRGNRFLGLHGKSLGIERIHCNTLQCTALRFSFIQA